MSLNHAGLIATLVLPVILVAWIVVTWLRKRDQ